jgi:ABC-type transport system involved in Fe-S cluster assembly fused permease/ATPase subunit
VLDLDLSFHLSRKTGEVTKVVDRGTAAIQNVLSTILFSIAPQVGDRQLHIAVVVVVASTGVLSPAVSKAKLLDRLQLLGDSN